jgi:DNA replication and repair protein RecF
MKLNRLVLENFRNHQTLKFVFDQPTTIFIGPNAVGKTNILEAIYLLAHGDSFKADLIEEMIHFKGEYGRVSGQVAGGEEEDLGVLLTRGIFQGKRVQKRKYFVNGVPRQKTTFAGNLPLVLFRPEDLDLLTGPPQLRRSYLDAVLSLAHLDYRRSLGSYVKGLKRRNKILHLIQEGKAQKTALTFWNLLLVKEGAVLTDYREQYSAFINRTEQLGIRRRVTLTSSTITPARLEEYAAKEVVVGYTMVGPHKDDFKVMRADNGQDHDLALYGSRGEQRMAVLWLKLAELAYLKKHGRGEPMLLLDDIMSELDDKHQHLVFELLGQQQTILTTTEIKDWPLKETQVATLGF